MTSNVFGVDLFEFQSGGFGEAGEDQSSNNQWTRGENGESGPDCRYAIGDLADENQSQSAPEHSHRHDGTVALPTAVGAEELWPVDSQRRHRDSAQHTPQQDK